MVLRAQLIAKGGSEGSGVEIEVYTRNFEDNAGWTIITGASFYVSGADGDIDELHIPPSSTDGAGIEEELRLKITGDSTVWMTIRVFPPLFYDAAVGTA